MIQATTETNIGAYVCVKDNLSGTQTDMNKIRFLVKFTNDLDGSVAYAYAATAEIRERYTILLFTYESVLASVDLYNSEIHLLPAGYWKYEVYEVTWVGTVTVAKNFAPSTESELLSPAADNKGVVQGLVTKGKMYLAEKSGTEQVQFTEYTPTATDNYIYYGQ